jgi:hypothetical protein
MDTLPRALTVRLDNMGYHVHPQHTIDGAEVESQK